MASPTSPTHGKYLAIYSRRPNGFKGSGLNDLTWGTGATNVASALYEVEIDATGAPDTFQWRKNGGGYTTGVSITGGAQTLDEAQTVTFNATTGHTVADEWTAGNLVDEATTESGVSAQITDSTKQIIDPNNPPTWTDDGGAVVQKIDYTTATGYFSANVGNVTVDGNLAFIDRNSLEEVGYARAWSLDVSVDMADITSAGDEWKVALPGQASASGTMENLFIGTKTFFDAIEENASGTEAYFILELFSYDPDQDQTGDRFIAWATITGVGEGTSVGDVVSESVSFQVHGYISFTANT